MLRPSCRPAPTALPQPVATSPRVPASVEHHWRGEGPRITPSLGGWGMPEWDALLDPQPGCRVAEQAPVSREAGGEAHERLGGLFSVCAALRTQGCSMSCPCPPPCPSHRSRALAEQEGRCHPSRGPPWGPSSMSQGHLLDTALEVRHCRSGRPLGQNWGSPRWPLHQGPSSPTPLLAAAPVSFLKGPSLPSPLSSQGSAAG